ncbi:cAMP-binding domain of CRP or a regulatory subunit of cAMP-dependent protein kinases [Persephonella hydrogeniphila]|uniref:cAMP-binding domain of CRP or a regulatory subunit of cAMP-dependent protein kinases n=1 Tax=Persephonella hydrogeniphila TaxID=198703 RepID=A0A285N321_9AQUI|nr:Crp/Fnr family transcriptional regulator [Persephonella hydrogeniphila]SNZ03874.1 cAMP-binding domain of CRP or a regulatory subunit of cAMP-dependent protein kinases [Persephonella hydrogeniphila]
MEKENFLKEIPLLEGIPEEELKKISKYFHLKEYKKNEYIFFEGDEEPGIYIVIDGIVKLIKETTDGKTVILRLVTPKEVFGWLVMGDSKPSSTYTAQALVDTKVLYISNQDFLKLLNLYPALAVKITCDASKMLLEAYDRLKSLAAEKVEGRIANLLLELSRKIGREEDDKIVIKAPITRQDLAEMTGTTVETAIRIMSKWKKEGIVNTERGKIEILDPDYLEDLIA